MLKSFYCLSPTPAGARAVLLLALLSAGLAPAASGQVTFAPKTDYWGGNGPVSVAVGDFNGDGRLDMVTANNRDNTVSVLLAKSNGSGFLAKTDYPTGNTPESVAVGDFNGDGRPDLAVANFATSTATPATFTVSVLLAKADGSGFLTKTDYPVGGNAVGIAVGDFNGDGRPDLVTANFGNTVSVLLAKADGSGFLTKTDYPTSSSLLRYGPWSVAVGDFNGDGRLDIVAANDGTTVSVLLAKADGSGFLAKTDYPAGNDPRSVAVADFNGDGRPDLVTASFAGSTTVSVLLAKADGSGFLAKTDYPVGSNPWGVAVGDFNSDGRPDLVAANSDNTVSVLLAKADGSGFLAKTDYPASGKYSNVAVGDLNADGRPDVVTTNFDGGLSVLLNTTAGTSLASAPALTATEINVFPNPTSGRFTVLMPALAGARTVDVALLNSLGQVVRRQSAGLSASGAHFEVAAGGLSAGLYLLRLSAGPTTLTKRVVLQ